MMPESDQFKAVDLGAPLGASNSDWMNLLTYNKVFGSIGSNPSISAKFAIYSAKTAPKEHRLG
jgi:hypothetical protein